MAKPKPGNGGNGRSPDGPGYSGTTSWGKPVPMPGAGGTTRKPHGPIASQREQGKPYRAGKRKGRRSSYRTGRSTTI